VSIPVNRPVTGSNHSKFVYSSTKCSDLLIDESIDDPEEEPEV
jgi:hypothetical protein